MNKKKAAVVTLCAVMALAGMGCGNKKQDMAAETTPAPTATPVPVTSTPTPMPTPTQAPKLIGIKTDTAKYVTLINRAGVDLREIYIQDEETEEWGNNLIPAESSVEDKEQVEMYYEPQDDGEYQIKIVTEDAEEFEIYDAELDDMKQTTLYIEEGTAYLKYTSVSSKTEKTTTEINSSDDLSYEDEDTTSEDQSYSMDYGEDYDDSGYNDDGYYEDDGYDDSYDDGYDDGSGNDYDNGYNDGGSGGTDGSGDGSDDSSGNSDDTDGTDDGSGSDIVWDEDGNWSEY